MDATRVVLSCVALTVLLAGTASADPGDEFWASQFYRVGLAGQVDAFADYDGQLVIGGQLTAAGDVLVSGLASWDGFAWQAFAGGVDGSVSAMLVHDGNLYVAGLFETVGGVAAHNVARWDGGQWHALASGGDGIEALVQYGGALVALGDFSAAVGPAGAKLAAWDGSAWSALGDGPQMGSLQKLYAAAEYDGNLVVGGDRGYDGPFHMLAVWDGAIWSTPYPNPGDYPGVDEWEARSLAVYLGGLVVGGHFHHWEGVGDYYSGVARWDGSDWIGLGHGLQSPTPIMTDDHNIRCLFEFDGDLVAAGRIGQIDEPYDCSGVARWDGSQWHAMDWGVGIDWMVAENNSVEAIVVREIRLHIGGSFSFAGADNDGECYNIAQWVDDSWQAVGPWGWGQRYPMQAIAEYEGEVVVGGVRYTQQGPEPMGDMPAYAPQALLAHDGSLIAGGAFTSVGDLPAAHVAAWDGTAWSAMGAGVPIVVEALGTYEGEIFAGPYRWTGATWVDELQTDGPIYALLEWEGSLYATGDFETARGVAAPGIVRWDGVACHGLGSGFSGGQANGYALTVYAGYLVVGGSFYRAGGVDARHIASWDGVAFHDVAPGLVSGPSHYGVYAVAAYGNQLFAGGRVTHVDFDLGHIGRFDGTQWHALGSGLEDAYELNVYDLFINDHTLWVAGNFNSAGGRPSHNVAAWSNPDVLGSASAVAEPPAAVVALTAAPNPFNPRTTFAFALPRAGDATLAVYDAAGRRVATLIAGSLPAGPSSFTWDGRDGDGRAVPSGVYLARLSSGGTVQRCRVTLVR